MLYFRKGCGSHSPTHQDFHPGLTVISHVFQIRRLPFSEFQFPHLSKVENHQRRLCCCWLVIQCPTLWQPRGLQPTRLLCPWASLSMGCPRQEHWSGLPFPPPGHLLNPGRDPCLLHLLHWQVGSLPFASPFLFLHLATYIHFPSLSGTTADFASILRL